jgi:hypothetical protein
MSDLTPERLVVALAARHLMSMLENRLAKWCPAAPHETE